MEQRLQKILNQKLFRDEAQRKQQTQVFQTKDRKTSKQKMRKTSTPNTVINQQVSSLYDAANFLLIDNLARKSDIAPPALQH